MVSVKSLDRACTRSLSSWYVGKWTGGFVTVPWGEKEAAGELDGKERHAGDQKNHIQGN